MAQFLVSHPLKDDLVLISQKPLPGEDKNSVNDTQEKYNYGNKY